MILVSGTYHIKHVTAVQNSDRVVCLSHTCNQLSVIIVVVTLSNAATPLYWFSKPTRVEASVKNKGATEKDASHRARIPSSLVLVS